MKKEIKKALSKAIDKIVEEENYYVDILNFENTLDKVTTLFENIYNIVPYKHIFRPKLGFYICLLPFESIYLYFRLDLSEKEIEVSRLYKSDCVKRESGIVVYIEFFPHFGKEYNPIVKKFIPNDAQDLRIYIDSTYFSIPIEVSVTKYDLI